MMRLAGIVPIVLCAVLALGEQAFAKKAAAAPPANGLGCTLAAVPPVVEAGGDVTLTLRVIGSGGATKTWIDDRDLKSAVGGSSKVTVVKTATFVGRVQKGKVTSTCSVEVKVGKPEAPADCKDCTVEPAT